MFINSFYDIIINIAMVQNVIPNKNVTKIIYQIYKRYKYEMICNVQYKIIQRNKRKETMKSNLGNVNQQQ